ncbi:hypothetical protein T4D_14075 [Trichinella pseudospiralis]|uniref:Uncharacterized protein n=1 Tax=Trichinella pseudospiralis TaxID=6337 RepID=A0A0V1G012_TRIPS|nr:hypothetical protein T4D_14075 [Trichinella pseudospiralis]
MGLPIYIGVTIVFACCDLCNTISYYKFHNRIIDVDVWLLVLKRFCLQQNISVRKVNGKQIAVCLTELRQIA